MLLTAAAPASAQTFEVLHAFDPAPEGGGSSGLVQATDGNFYGTTSGGGSHGDGTVYRMTPDGTFTVLHAFSGADGEDSRSALMQASDGNLYGTASAGGTYDRGVVFRLTLGGSLTVLHHFTGTNGDGSRPGGTLIQARDGLLYGTTYYGGLNGHGTVFRMTLDGTVTILHHFAGGDGDGANPDSGVIQARDGNFYGTTNGGGSLIGTVFRMTPGGFVTVLRSLYSFDGDYSPMRVPGLTEAVDGSLYGTTQSSFKGTHGSLFRVTPDGHVTYIREFDYYKEAGPDTAVIQGTDGNLYSAATGSTFRGIARVTPAGSLTYLHEFDDSTEGTATWGSLVQGTDGHFYGVTVNGGPTGAGTIFRLRVFPDGCAFTPDPSSVSVPTAGDAGTLTVFTSPACAWTAVSSDPGWLTVTAGSSGSGSGTVSYSASANLSGLGRSATLIVGGRVVPVNQPGTLAPSLSLSASRLVFGAARNGGTLTSVTTSQRVALTQTGEGPVTWTASATQPWIEIAGGAGAGSGFFTVTIRPAGLPAAGSATGTVTITANGAPSPPDVTIEVTLLTAGATQAPFGRFDAPMPGATGVSGSLGVMGWALDDVEVTRVRIYRSAVSPEPAGSQVYVGDAVLVDGARPDVAAAYPGWPLNGRAGWGYLLLTNALPNQGNGTFTLFAYADDIEGHRALLGVRSFTGDNLHATAPFGTIDTPRQGETVSGPAYVNFGWALTPWPKGIAYQGWDITVWVDGVAVGQPGALAPRADIQAQFPGYVNTDFAVGAFVLDTTRLADGVHTIAWTVTDGDGASAGIGSRYFTVANGSFAVPSASGQFAPSAMRVLASPVRQTSVLARRGFDETARLDEVPLRQGTHAVTAHALERVELRLGPPATPGSAGYAGYQRVGTALRPLPVGSMLDGQSGRFTWQPGVGFLGTHELVFTRTEADGALTRIPVTVTLTPAERSVSDVQLAIDLPQPGSVVQPFVVAGWALDRGAVAGTGIDTVHVWAYPVTATGYGTPVFVGVARYGDRRPDVGAYFGARFATSAFGLVANGLAPGTYDLAVFPYSTVTGEFAAARVVRVSVR